MTSGTDLAKKIRRIAVVAIHGVGDHPPFATAKEIGDLLSDLKYQPSGTPRYAPFTEVVQRVNVRPVKVTPPFEGSANLDAMAKYRYAGGELGASLDYLYTEGQLKEYRGEWPEDTYEMLRLEGRRIAPVTAVPEAKPKVEADAAGGIVQELRSEGVTMPQDETRRREATGSPTAAPGTQEKVVHVYEMYWADLSKLSNAFTQIFGELYQLLFQLTSVGMNNVKAAAITFHGEPGGKEWRSFDWWQSIASNLLAETALILNLFMAALLPPIFVVSMMRRHLNATQEFVALVGLVGLLTAVIWGWKLLKSGRFSNKENASVKFVTPPVLIALLVSLGALAAYRHWILGRESTEALCAGIIGLLGLGGVVLVVSVYDKRRPGALRKMRIVAVVLLVTTFLAWLVGGLTFLKAQQYKSIVACINLIEIGFWLLTATWMFFYVTYFGAYYTGWRAVRAASPGKDRPRTPDVQLTYDRARRTRWTARLLLALPATGFAILILIAWSGVVQLCLPLLPGDETYQAASSKTCSPKTDCPVEKPAADDACKANCGEVKYEPVISMSRLRGEQTEWTDAETWVYQSAMKNAGIVLLPVFLGAVLLALLIAMWGLAPVVWEELYPPSAANQQILEKEAASLGHWLTEGFTFMHLSGLIIYFTMFIPPALLVWHLLVHYFGFPALPTMPEITIAKVAGALVVGAAVGLLGFSGRLKSVALGFRPAVRVMLDVDNWLREYPRDSNPTARICGRYASVLRHIVAWRDDPQDEDSGYQALVIIAHSQGTVITADLLRYLEAKKEAATARGEVYDPELEGLGGERLPIYLFTMGCPLRQLYGLRFPYLYGWVRGANKKATGYKAPDIDLGDTPDPKTLGISQWVNAFRSGDYVGRNLWRADDSSYRWDPIPSEKPDDWDPPAGKPEKISSDKNGTRIEFCIGPGAHTHYWDHTGALIAQTLDRIINAA